MEPSAEGQVARQALGIEIERKFLVTGDAWRGTVARSQRIGLRLYAIALEPICSSSKGSDSSANPDSRRTSFAKRVTLTATLPSVVIAFQSARREYV
jgi:hypothetical protein